MPLPLICLLTTLPALQAPAPDNAVQAVLDAARAKAKAVMEARADSHESREEHQGFPRRLHEGAG